MEKFHSALGGYNKEEVNVFVQNVISQVESIVRSEKEKDEQIKILNSQIARYKNMENMLNRVVIVAEEAGHQIKKTAHIESEQIIDNARKSANRIVNDAISKAEEAQKEVDNLKRSVSSYKRKVKDVIETQLSELNRLDDFK